MTTRESTTHIIAYRKKLENNLDDFRTNDSNQSITGYKIANGEILISIQNIISETELDKNNLAYNLRVLSIRPEMVWNRTYLYSIQDVITLLTYILQGLQLEQFKFNCKDL